MSDAARVSEPNVLLSMCDQAGITRIKLIPAARRESALRDGVSFSLTSALLLGADDSIADLPRFPAAHGDVRLIPDPAALRTLDDDLQWAPVDQRTPDGAPFSVCQRSILADQAARLRGIGLEPILAFELEFAVYRPAGDGWELLDDTSAYGLESFVRSEAWMTDLIAALDRAGVPVEQVHPEYGPGQYEVALGVRDPVTAVDDYALARIVISRVLRAHGLRASFSPKPELRAAGNGCHIHVSARRDGRNVFAGAEEADEADAEFDEVGGQWIGALVEHLPDSLALLSSGPHSYARLQPGAFSGAYSCWGRENREAAVRYIPGAAGRRGRGANIEIKVPDATANPYLAAATILALGLHGIATGAELPAPLGVVPAKASGAELSAARASPLPGSLSEALRRLDGNRVLRAALGDDVIETFIGLRSLDLASESVADPEELLLEHRWRQ